jgi:metallophosphoesterase (TIGR00282 family)
MRLLAIGDIIGSPGRRAISRILHSLKNEHQIDLVMANAENVAGGLGLTPSTAEELYNAGCDILTSGNHIWAHKEILPYLDSDRPILRPLNYPPGVPGRGHLILNDVLFVNLMGRTFMGQYDCPFRKMDSLLAEIDQLPRIIVVDFHAEATSEKVALGHYLDGRVSAVLGTHTHIGTIDWQLLPGGTAFVSDIGMTGPVDSIIGDDIDDVLKRFLTGLPHRLSVGHGPVNFTGILVDIDHTTGQASTINRISQEVS